MHRRWLLFFAGVLLAAANIAGAAAEVDAKIPKTKFSCNGRSSGYYADVDSGCQVYHMCDGLGRQFSYTCPNATLFQQRMLICDHWYMVNCSKSVDDYAANLRIGQREMPFVDDSESNPYHRTPRPDLLSHHSQSEYDIIYRTGKAYMGNNLNLVGAESDSKNKSASTTDEPTYSLPSHWSTEYSRQHTTANPKKDSENRTERKPFVASTESPLVNFKSSYKATTPVFPATGVTESPDDSGGEILNHFGSSEKSFSASTESPFVNFESSYKATTPVFPETVNLVSESPDDLKLLPPLPYSVQNKSVDAEVAPTEVPTNFKSFFKATTPVYPTSVDITSEEPSDVGLLPPNGPGDSNKLPSLDLEIRPPSVDSSSEEITEAQPSKYYQPPKFDQNRNGGFKVLDNEEWENLRKKFLIPDYEFPLESVSRPSYDSLLSSFQVNSGPPENVIKVTKDAA